MSEETSGTPKGEQPNPFAFWMNTQKAWTDAWKGMTDQATKMSGQAGMANFAPMYETWVKNFSDNSSMLSGSNVSEPLRKTMANFLDAGNAYLKLFRTWMGALEQWHKGLKPAVDAESLKGWISTLHQMFENMMGLPALEPIQKMLGPAGAVPAEFLKMMTGNARAAGDAWFQAVFPWMKAADGMGWSAAGVMDGAGDSATYRTFHDSWMGAYKEAMGKFLNMPSIGPARLSSENLMKTGDAFFKFYGASIDFLFRMYEPAIQSFDKLSEKMRPLFDKEVTPETFKEFYNMFLDVSEERFHETFKSESFTQGMHLMLSAALELRRQSDEMIESMLKNTPVVTRSEADVIHKELYELKKKVRALEAKLGGALQE